MLSAERPTRLRALDGIRGVAILLVVVPHLELDGGLFGPPVVGRVIEMFGHGVDLFFVLSGFGLALPILAQLRAGRGVALNLPTFYFDRLFRIVPLYYIATALCFTFSLVMVLSGHRLAPVLSLPHSLWDALAPLLFLDRATEFVNANFWSIPVQVRWYAAFPFVLAVYVFSRRLFCGLIVAAWLAYLTTRMHALDLGTLPLFMLGIVAADMFVCSHPWRRYALWLLPAAILLGHFSDRWASAPDPYGNELHWTLQPTTLGWQLAAFLFVVAATENAVLARLLAWRPMTALGAISFSVYLVHEPALATGLLLFGPHQAVLAGALALGAGALMWYALERPLTARSLRHRVRGVCLPALERVLDASQLQRQVRFPLAAPSEPQLGATTG
jgi:peptidoglycan/LPS O-acetylase OafA/YrhL